MGHSCGTCSKDSDATARARGPGTEDPSSCSCAARSTRGREHPDELQAPPPTYYAPSAHGGPAAVPRVRPSDEILDEPTDVAPMSTAATLDTAAEDTRRRVVSFLDECAPPRTSASWTTSAEDTEDGKSASRTNGAAGTRLPALPEKADDGEGGTASSTDEDDLMAGVAEEDPAPVAGGGQSASGMAAGSWAAENKAAQPTSTAQSEMIAKVKRPKQLTLSFADSSEIFIFNRQPIGMVLRDMNPITVTGFKADSDAQAAGVKIGWQLIRINDVDVRPWGRNLKAYNFLQQKVRELPMAK